jgi:hypothetical protein
MVGFCFQQVQGRGRLVDVFIGIGTEAEKYFGRKPAEQVQVFGAGGYIVNQGKTAARLELPGGLKKERSTPIAR